MSVPWCCLWSVSPSVPVSGWWGELVALLRHEVEHHSITLGACLLTLLDPSNKFKKSKGHGVPCPLALLNILGVFREGSLISPHHLEIMQIIPDQPMVSGSRDLEHFCEVFMATWQARDHCSSSGKHQARQWALLAALLWSCCGTWLTGVTGHGAVLHRVGMAVAVQRHLFRCCHGVHTCCGMPCSPLRLHRIRFQAHLHPFRGCSGVALNAIGCCQHLPPLFPMIFYMPSAAVLLWRHVLMVTAYCHENTDCF